MPSINLKAVVWFVVIVILLSQIDKILAVLLLALRILHTCLAPLKYAPEPAKVGLASLVLALVFVVVWSFLMRKL